MILKLNIICVYPNYECIFLYFDTSAHIFHKNALMYKFEITKSCHECGNNAINTSCNFYTFI